MKITPKRFEIIINDGNCKTYYRKFLDKLPGVPKPSISLLDACNKFAKDYFNMHPNLIKSERGQVIFLDKFMPDRFYVFNVRDWEVVSG